MEHLRRTDDAAVTALRASIRDKLTDGAQGDFVKLGYKLDEISRKRRPAEISEVLEHAAEDRLDAISRVIETLNRKLGEEDIKDLNLILTWVIGGSDIIGSTQITTALLEQALFAQNKQKSLMPLEDQIKTHFSDILYFNQAPVESEDSISKSNTPIHRSEVAIVKRFLRSVCDDELFEKFGFEDFFQKKLGIGTTHIHVDVNRIHFEILNTLFEALNSGSETDCDQLVNYLWKEFPNHMERADLSYKGHAVDALKSFIGTAMIGLFTDDNLIKKWWFTASMDPLTKNYVRDEFLAGKAKSTESVMKFLKDPSVTSGLTREMKEWLDRIMDEETEEDIFKPTVRVMAGMWLRSSEVEGNNIIASRWLLRYFDMVCTFLDSV